MTPEKTECILSPEQIELLRRSMCSDLNKDEFETFVQQCNRTKLDPFSRQIYAVSRYDKKAGRKKMSIQVSIDGFRLIAERTGEYEGQTKPEWCGPDGIWRDCWLQGEPPSASRVGVWRKGFREPCWGVAKTDSYMSEDGMLWRKMPEVMIAKCAEALALRKAFPQELSGLYTSDEMAQAGLPEAPASPQQPSTPPSTQPEAKNQPSGQPEAKSTPPVSQPQPQKLTKEAADELDLLQTFLSKHKIDPGYVLSLCKEGKMVQDSCPSIVHVPVAILKKLNSEKGQQKILKRWQVSHPETLPEQSWDAGVGNQKAQRAEGGE